MKRVTVLDGGLGRELKRMGAPFRQPEWSALALIESPDDVRRAHEAFVAAGAEVIITNAYAVVPYHIGQERFDADGRRLAELAGELARTVAGESGVLVAGCLPPPLGSYRPDAFVAADARPILDVLVEAQAPFVDVWLAETVSSIAEAVLMRSVLDVAGEARPLWIAFTLDDEMTDYDSVHPTRLRSTEPVADAVAAAEALGADLVAFNCSQPEVMEDAVRQAAAATDLPIGVYANIFDVHDHDGANTSVHDLRNDVTPEVYVGFAERWVEAGASMVGGCCGVGPAHIAALSARWRGE